MNIKDRILAKKLELDGAERRLESARDEYHTKFHELHELLSEFTGVDIDDVEIGAQDCAGSPTGQCYYNNDADPAWDHCLVCGQPHERG